MIFLLDLILTMAGIFVLSAYQIIAAKVGRRLNWENKQNDNK